MINPFKRFYDTEVGVYEKRGGGYGEKGEMSFLGNVVCDLQPLEAGTEEKIYGLSSDRSYTLYCDKNELLKTGRFVLFGGARYIIVSVTERRFGASAVIRSVEDEN